MLRVGGGIALRIPPHRYGRGMSDVTTGEGPTALAHLGYTAHLQVMEATRMRGDLVSLGGRFCRA